MNRRTAFSIIISFVLLWLMNLAFAQWVVADGRINNPTFLSQKRTPILAKNVADINLLAVWGFGRIGNVAWLDNETIAVGATSGTWIYDLHSPDTPKALLPELIVWTDFRPPQLLASPDGQWLTLMPDVGSSTSVNPYFSIWHVPTGIQINLLDSGDTANPLRSENPVQKPRQGFTIWLADSRLLTALGPKIVIWRLKGEAVEPETVLTHPRTERTDYNIEQIAVTPEGDTIVTVTRAAISDQLIIQVWDVKTGERRVLYQDEFLPAAKLLPTNIQFSRNAKEIGLVMRYLKTPPESRTTLWGEFWRWNIESGAALPSYTIDCQAQNVNFASNYIICMWDEYRDNREHVYLTQLRRLDDGEVLSEPYVNMSIGGIFAATSTSGNYIIVTNAVGLSVFQGDINQNDTHIWNEMGREIAFLDSDFPSLRAVVFSPDESRLAIVGLGEVDIWDVTAQSRITTLRNGEYGAITDLALSPDSRYLVTTSVNGAAPAVRWDLTQGTWEAVVSTLDEKFRSVAYSPNGKLLVIGDSDGLLHLYDAASLKEQNTLFNDGVISRLRFSHDGRLLAVANQRYSRIWDTRTWEVVNRVALDGHVGSIVFTPDDDWLIQTGQIWKLENGGQLLAAWPLETAPTEVQWAADLSVEYSSVDIDFTRHLALTNGHLQCAEGEMRFVGGDKSLWRGLARCYETHYILFGEDILIIAKSDGVIHLYGVAEEGENQP
jgi:WD40 repeat protein